MKFKTIILFSILATLVAIYSAAINWLFQFFIIGLVYFFSSLYILSKDDSKFEILKLIILVFPFTFIYSYVFFTNPNPTPNLKVIPILIIPILSSIAAYIIYALKSNKWCILFYTVLVCLLSFIGMPNWINYIADDENPISVPFPELDIQDINGNSFVFDDGKVIVVDLWSTSCGVCIKKFPNFEALKLKYENDENVIFYTLNLPLKRDSIINTKNYVKDYKFKSLFTKDFEAWNKLNNETVPKLLILDKSKTIVYKGNINDKWYHFYNNVNALIDKYKNE